jgi:hypothetical protein
VPQWFLSSSTQEFADENRDSQVHPFALRGMRFARPAGNFNANFTATSAERAPKQLFGSVQVIEKTASRVKRMRLLTGGL